MNREQWSRLREVFFAVCQAPAEERETVLATLCAGDAESMAGVRELLAADDESVAEGGDRASFLDQPALGRVLSEVALNEVGAQSLTLEQIGPYRVVQKLGEGGMGAVFEADQEHPRRKVAVKVLRPGATSPQILRRFRQEADMLAQLQHPGIARIYDAGIADVTCKGQVIGRQPFFAMELILGSTITDYVRSRKPTTREVMRLMSLVADAVQHAHQNGVIHRDLKPGNILVDVSGNPKVLDFGVARSLDALNTRATLQTQTGQIVGTLAYMSPEQVGGDSARVDTRSDVYSVGVVLYELLAGRPPHELRGLTLTEAIRIIRDESPDDLDRGKPEFHGDVSRIVAKAMAKERERRYQSAAAFAEDIRRYLADQPVLARPTSAMYQLRKFTRRNKALVGGAVATLASLLLGMAGIVWFAIGESRARTHAESASKKAERLAHRVSIAAASDAIQLFSLGQARSLLQSIPVAERKWEWRYLWNQLDDSFLSLPGANHQTANLRFFPDASGLLAESGGSLVRWDLRTQAMTGLLHGVDDHQIDVSLDLTHAAALGIDGDIRLLDLRSGRSRQLQSAGIQKGVVALSPDGSRIALGGEDGELRVLSEKSDVKTLSTKVAGAVRSMHFAPQGPYLAIQTSEQSIVLDIVSGEIVDTIPIPDSRQADLYAWLKDGSRLLSYFHHSPVRLVRSLRIAPVSPEEPLRGLTDELTTLIVSPDDQYAIGCQYDGKIHMWSLRSGTIIRTFQCASSGAYGVALHPRGHMLAVGDISGLVRVFDVASGHEIGVLRGLTDGVASIAFNTDGDVIAAGANDGAVRLWRSDAVRDLSVLRGHTSYVYPVTFSLDGQTVASGSWDLTVRLWDATTGQELNVLRGHKSAIHWLSFSADGQQVLSFALTKGIFYELIVWDIKTGRLIAQTSEPMLDDGRPVFCPDGDRVWLTGTKGDLADLWNYRANTITREPLSALRGVKSPWISPDQQTMARFVGDESRLELVDIATGLVRHALCSHVTRAVFSPDNRKIAGLSRFTSSTDGGVVVEVWLVQTGERVGELRHEGGEIYDVGFSPDGTRIATCGRDKLIHFWDAGTFEEIVGLRGHSDYVWSIAWSPDGSQLVSGSGDSTVRLWSTTRPSDPR